MGMPSLLTPLLAPLVDLLWAKAEPFLDEKFDELSDKVLALLPVLAGAAAKGATEEVLEKIPGVSAIGRVPGLADLTEQIRDAVNAATPAGVHIPGLDELTGLFNKDPQL